MLKPTVTMALMIVLGSLLVNPHIYAQKATVDGTVKDAQTGDALPGANVVLAGTSMGASTDITGKYVIHNVPAGSYTLRATYVGYKPTTVLRPGGCRRDLASA